MTTPLQSNTSGKAVVFDRVTKSFGEVVVLDDLSFTADEGEKIALIGPSGSGKSTILRILITLETVQKGRVSVLGRPLNEEAASNGTRSPSAKYLSDVRSDIGMVFQHFNLFPHLSVLENIVLAPMSNNGTARAQAESEARDLLALVGLEDRADARPGKLSGGQKQRVAIARALALKPKVMLFDEVTSALDPELVEEVLNVLRTIAEREATTMLLVTHEMSFARDFADRVLFLDGGRIVEEGEPEQFFSDPKEPRSQAFLRKIVAGGRRI